METPRVARLRPCRSDDYPPHDPRRKKSGQALVEFALIVPVLLLLLVGVIGAGMYYLAGVQQASASSTIAAWIADNPSDPDALADYAATVTPCPVTVVYAENLATVRLECPTVQLLPMLPTTVVTTATAYVR